VAQISECLIVCHGVSPRMGYGGKRGGNV
jgi:hypothetical protein